VAFCHAVYGVACELPDVEVVSELADQLSRVGRGLVRVEHGNGSSRSSPSTPDRLLGYQWFLAEPQPFAPAGTLHSWSAFLQRTIVDCLPSDIPAIPNLPSGPPNGDRGFRIRPGLIIVTGHVSEAVAQLVKLLDEGVISQGEYESAKTYLADS
jgi:hypothetical protein